jgi:hypothetical protein
MNELEQNQRAFETHLALIQVTENLRQYRKQRDYYKAQMWICFIGWVVTAVILGVI